MCRSNWPGDIARDTHPGFAALWLTKSNNGHWQSVASCVLLPWTGKFTLRDYAALTLLIWEHLNPYGRFDLDMTSRLALA
jgi:hypothetical protein